MIFEPAMHHEHKGMIPRHLLPLSLLFLIVLGCSSFPIAPEAGFPHYRAGLTDAWTYQGVPIRYHRSGTGSPMIFLHNGGTDHRLWDFQIEHFSKTHTVYAIDLPGYGESGKPEGPCTLDFYTDMLAGFVNDHQLSSVTLIGNCMGSAMAMNYALQHHEKVSRLILFNLLTEDTLKDGAYDFLFQLSKDKTTRCMMVKALPHIWLPDFYIRTEMKSLYGDKGFSGEPDPDFLLHLDDLFNKPQEFPSLASLLMNMSTFRHLDNPADPNILPPTCLVWGEQNRVLLASKGKVLCAKYHFQKTYFIKNAGHMVMREDHNYVNTVMDEFL